jgi:choline monooxygenase
MESSEHRQDSALQLPVSWYVDPAVLEMERQHVLGVSPRYVGQEGMVPDPGNFHVLGWMDDAWMLVRTRDGVDLVSNVCRHRQSIMHKGRGTAKNIVCPIHRWSYDLHGVQRAAPHFSELPCLNLPTRPLQNWNGLLFDGPRDVAADLAGFSMASEFDYSDYVYDSTAVDEYPVNWKTFLEIYLELYHVEPFHSGLRGYADCGVFSPADWEFGERWSNQVMAVSFLIPQSPSSTINVVDFFYPPDVVTDGREIVEAHQTAYGESADEDRKIVERIDAGRRALYRQHLDDFGPYQEPLEDGMVHFHRWLRQRLEPHLNGGRPPGR